MDRSRSSEHHSTTCMNSYNLLPHLTSIFNVSAHVHTPDALFLSHLPHGFSKTPDHHSLNVMDRSRSSDHHSTTYKNSYVNFLSHQKSIFNVSAHVHTHVTTMLMHEHFPSTASQKHCIIFLNSLASVLIVRLVRQQHLPVAAWREK